MTMPDQNHPIWFIAKSVVIFAFCCLFAWTNSTNFDDTEYKMLMEIAAVLFGGAALESFFRKKTSS